MIKRTAREVRNFDILCWPCMKAVTNTTKQKTGTWFNAVCERCNKNGLCAHKRFYSMEVPGHELD